MPRFSANLSMLFTEHAFLDRFAAARAAGFAAVEFLFPYDHAPEAVAAALNRAGLALSVFNLPPGDWAAGERGLAALAGRGAEFRASVEAALPYARALGAARLHVMAGIAAGRAARMAYRDNLAHAADRLGEAGLDALIEPINPADMPGYHLQAAEDAAEIIAALGRPNLRLQFDVYHRETTHGDAEQAIRRFAPLIGHVQIAGLPGRHEPDDGRLDLGAVLAALDATGYEGWVGCEYHPRAGTVEGLGWLARARQAAAAAR